MLMGTSLYFRTSIDFLMDHSFCVATVMFSTSILIAVQIRYVKHLPIIIGLSYFIVFGFFDGVFLFDKGLIVGCNLWN